MRFAVLTTLVATIILALGVAGSPMPQSHTCIRSEHGVLDPRCSCTKAGECS
jgi:hypothetical protein